MNSEQRLRRFLNLSAEAGERRKLPTPVINNMRYQMDRAYHAHSSLQQFILSPVAYRRLCWEINNQRSPLSYTETPTDIKQFEGTPVYVDGDSKFDIRLNVSGVYIGKLPEQWKEGFE